MKSNITICAVVVTFNRKTLLQRTLNALFRQTRAIDKILVIDNASSDGTYQMLLEKGYLDHSNLEYISLSENTGGAGGFYQGVKKGYEQGYDWLWLMDDDGYPTDECLAQLLEYKNRFNFFGPLVIDDQQTERISFPFFYHGQKVTQKHQAQTFSNNQIIDNHVSPFNGILVACSLVKIIGYPKAELFIWGDEINYWQRAKQAGAKIATLTNITFYHPTAPSLGTPMFFNKMQFNDTDSKVKLYCLCRNNAYNLKTYHSPIHAGLFTIKAAWFYTFTKPSLQKLKFCMPALWHGWKGDFTHHRAFIGKNF